MGTIIRIQDAEGRGMYRSTNSLDCLSGDDVKHSRHPLPSDDSLLVENAPQLFNNSFFGPKFQADNFVFGYKDFAQMRSWLYDDRFLDAAHENGFSVLIMEGEVYCGNAQAVINQDTAKVLREMSIPEFLAENV